MTSARLRLPFIAPGQAQKETTHNEALAMLDMTIWASAESLGLNDAPVAPDAGQAWILGGLPTGEWSGRANYLAAWTDGGWRFLQPFQGLHVWLLDDDMFARWDGANWVAGIIRANSIEIEGDQVVGSRRSAIPDPSGGAIVDVEARYAIEDILAALRGHGLIQA